MNQLRSIGQVRKVILVSKECSIVSQLPHVGFFFF